MGFLSNQSYDKLLWSGAIALKSDKDLGVAKLGYEI
jgi:hypothetical protein